MCTCTCECLFACTCVYLCLDTGVHVCAHVAASPGNDVILSSYIFLVGWSCRYLHVMPASYAVIKLATVHVEWTYSFSLIIVRR